MQLRPFCFATYIALSASPKRIASFCFSWLKSVMPMLALHSWVITLESSSSSSTITYGAFTCNRIFEAILSASSLAHTASSPKSPRASKNSSPPKRATVSTLRTHVLSRFATSIRSKSPALCPYASLSGLKLSRSSAKSAP